MNEKKSPTTIVIRILALVGSFLWIAFVYASYYLVQQQRPFMPVHLQAVLSLLLNLGTAALIWVVSFGFGSRLCRWLGVEFDHTAERLLLSSGVGLGALSLLVLGLGVLGWFKVWSLALLLGLVGAVGSFDVVDVVRQSRLKKCGDSAEQTKHERSRDVAIAYMRPTLAQGIYLGGSVLLALLVTLTPPTSWDGLFYHLTMPQHYLAQGGIVPITDVPHQFYPGLMEMLYTLAMALRGDVAAKLLHFVYMLLLGGVVFALAARTLPKRGWWPAVIVYASMPMVFVLGSWAYNDLALAFYQLAAVYALFVWLDKRSWPWLILSGVLCGFALGLKYTAFICPLTLALFIGLWCLQRRIDWGHGLRALLILAGIVFLVGVPWYAKNWAMTGNPVYPFAYGLFGGPNWDAWRAEWYARAGTGLGWNLGPLVRLPWTLTLGIQDMNFFDGRMGPLFLLALPVLLLWSVRLFDRKRQNPWVGQLVLFAAVQYVVWMFGVISSRSLFQTRLLLPAFAALCVPMVHVYDWLSELDTRVLSLKRLVGMTVVLILAATLCYQALDVLRRDPLPVLFGEEDRDAFLTRTLGAHYAAMQLVNNKVDESGRVLFLWEPRSYYCQRDAQPDPILERWAWLRHHYGQDFEMMTAFLRQEGYTHLLLHKAGLEFMRETRLDPLDDGDFDAWDTFSSRYLQQEDAVGDAYVLYRFE